MPRVFPPFSLWFSELDFIALSSAAKEVTKIQLKLTPLTAPCTKKQVAKVASWIVLENLKTASSKNWWFQGSRVWIGCKLLHSSPYQSVSDWLLCVCLGKTHRVDLQGKKKHTRYHNDSIWILIYILTWFLEAKTGNLSNFEWKIRIYTNSMINFCKKGPMKRNPSEIHSAIKNDSFPPSGKWVSGEYLLAKRVSPSTYSVVVGLGVKYLLQATQSFHSGDFSLKERRWWKFARIWSCIGPMCSMYGISIYTLTIHLIQM